MYTLHQRVQMCVAGAERRATALPSALSVLQRVVEWRTWRTRRAWTCEHVFVAIKVSPYVWFKGELASGDLLRVRAAAADLPSVPFGDALRICLLMRDQEPERYEQACLRWLARFCLERRGVTIGHVERAARAFAVMRRDPQAAMELLEPLCR
jgi:hypothetical protein